MSTSPRVGPSILLVGQSNTLLDIHKNPAPSHKDSTSNDIQPNNTTMGSHGITPTPLEQQDKSPQNDHDQQSPHGTPAAAMSLHEVVTQRHSSREYLPTPVPPAALRRALALAERAPSNSNVQPWRLWVLSGPPLAGLKRELMAHASSDEAPQIPPLPAWAHRYRSHLGRLVYGEGWDIARDDAEGRRNAVLRNFEFFGAPMGAIVCMKNDLDFPDSLSVGMYLQTLVLALQAEGLSSCVQVSIAGYSEVARKTLGIPDDMLVICGMAIGFENPTHKVNTIRPPKMGFTDTTVILE